MTREDLLSMLDLRPSQQVAADSDLETRIVNRITKGTSSTALQLDSWDLAQGERCRDNSAKLKDLSNEAVADFHGAAFIQRPQLNEEPCDDVTRQRFMETLLESPDYRVLHESTQANTLASEMACNEFGEKFLTLVEQEAQDDEGRSPEEEEIASEVATIAAVQQAVSQAQEQVEALEDTTRALGLGEGTSGQNLSADAIASVFRRCRDSKLLRRICELAGRYRRAAQAAQRSKTTHGYDDLVGVELAGDIGRLLPVELAMLADEDFELDAMRRLVERQSMCREYRGVERQAKGPIVVCVDESGSMDGEPVCNAKAFALAMAWIAQHQRRWCCLVGYSGGKEGTWLTLPPGRWDRNALCEWLEHFYGAGTTMDVPLAELPANWEQLGVPRGKTDVIIITDAVVRVPAGMSSTFNAWKAAEQVKCHTLVIGSESAGGPGSSVGQRALREVDQPRGGWHSRLFLDLRRPFRDQITSESQSA